MASGGSPPSLAVCLLLLAALCGHGPTGATSSLVFPQRRPPPPPAGQLSAQLSRLLQLLERRSEGELLARLNRLEGAVALHHRATARRLEAITAHLAALSAPDRQLAALVEETRQERRQVATLTEQVRAGRQQRDVRLRQLVSAVRSQGRALLAFRAALPSRQLSQAVTNSSDEVRKARDDVLRVWSETNERGRHLQQELADVKQLVTETGATTARLDGTVSDQTVSLQDGFRLVDDSVRQLHSQLVNQTALEDLVDSVAPLVTAAESRHDQLESISTNMQAVLAKVTSTEKMTADFLPELDKRVNKANEKSELRSRQLRQEFSGRWDDVDSQLLSTRAQLEVHGAVLNDTSAEVVRAAAEVKAGLDTLQTQQDALLDGVGGVEASVAGLADGHSSLSASITALTGAVQGAVGEQGTLSGVVGAVTAAVDRLQGGQTVQGATMDAAMMVLGGLVEGQQSLSTSLSGVQTAVDRLTEGQRLLEDSLNVVEASLKRDNSEEPNVEASPTTEPPASTATPTTEPATTMASPTTEPPATAMPTTESAATPMPTTTTTVQTTKKPFSLFDAFFETVREREERNRKFAALAGDAK